MHKLDKIAEDSLSEADLSYYTEVNAIILKKLSEVSLIRRCTHLLLSDEKRILLIGEIRYHTSNNM